MSAAGHWWIAGNVAGRYAFECGHLCCTDRGEFHSHFLSPRDCMACKNAWTGAPTPGASRWEPEVLDSLDKSELLDQIERLEAERDEARQAVVDVGERLLAAHIRQEDSAHGAKR